MASAEPPVKLLAYNGELLSFQLTNCPASAEGTRRGSALRFKRMAFRPSTGAFAITSEGLVPIAGSSLDLVACGAALDVKKCLVVPCILLRQFKKKSGCFRYVLLTFSNSNVLDPQLEFKLHYNMKDNVTLSQGPTVLWSHDDMVYYTSLQAGEVMQVPVALSSVCLIGALPVKGILVLGTERSAKQGHGVGSGDTRFLGYCLDDGRVFDGAWVLPHAYSAVVRCVLIVASEDWKGQLKTSVVAATSRNQLVWCEDGIPRDVCQLPFEQPEGLQMVSRGRDVLFVITFSSGEVCAVWKDSFQVAASWQGVRSVHVDDFVGCGTDQILLLFENRDAVEGVLDDFTITDLGEISFSSTVDTCEDLDAAGDVQENYLLTVQALDARLQCGVASLQDLQGDLEMKGRVLLQSVRALTSLITGDESGALRTEEEGLASLWEEDADAGGLVPEAPQVSAEPAGLVERVWQRVVGDSWVVGVKLTEEAYSSVDNVNLSIMMDQGSVPAPAVTQTRGNVLWFSAPSFPCITRSSSPGQAGPAAKRTRVEEWPTVDSTRRRTAICVTDLTPLLALTRLDCPLLIRATVRREAGSWRRGDQVAFQCGRVSLDIKDVSLETYRSRLLHDCKHVTEEAVEDFLSLTAVLKKRTFQIRSVDRTLCDISKWLLGPMQCQQLAVNPDYLLWNKSTASDLMLFNWEVKSAFEGLLIIHSSSESCLLKFLHSLCGFLPPSYEVKPLRAGTTEDLAENLAFALEQEVQTLKGSVSTLIADTNVPGLNEAQARRSRDLSSVPAEEGLEQYRRGFELDRTLSRLKMGSLVDMNGYRWLTASLAAVQLGGDVAARALCTAFPDSERRSEV